MYKQTGKMPKRLAEAKAVPSATAYLWRWYKEIVTGLEPLTYTEILAWSTLHKHDLKDWELQGIKDLDRLRIKILGSTA